MEGGLPQAKEIVESPAEAEKPLGAGGGDTHFRKLGEYDLPAGHGTADTAVNLPAPAALRAAT